ncbi:MAG TPA: sporulation protein YhbH, partial [Gammaproteobacteria bacterium]|nr:sporulation protein YhbH [Gammaproteobacteria bacterium]
MSTIFRDYSHGDALRSDRSASDRQRHRKKIRSSLQENIADVIAEESIIGQNREKVIKVPIRGIKEYRFVYGDNSGGAAQGDGESQPGQVVGQDGQPGDQPGPAGDQPGVDFYETDI